LLARSFAHSTSMSRLIAYTTKSKTAHRSKVNAAFNEWRRPGWSMIHLT